MVVGALQDGKASRPFEEALQTALRYLGYRPRTETELRNHLSERGADPLTVQRIVERLRELNYLNDRNFAQSWAAAKVAGRGYGPKRIALELRNKGITEALIRDVVSEAFSGDAEKHNAKKLLLRNFKQLDATDPKQLRRALGFLQRRGYSSAVIYELLNATVDED